MEIKQITRMGMELDECTYESCIATVGYDNTWATIYHIESSEPGKGHATELLTRMKTHYESLNKEFASSIALTARMKFLLKKLNIKEYE